MLNQLLLRDIRKLNSITKYPSIYTYHKLGRNGRLEEEVLEEVEGDIDGFATEKVDGTNSRMIFSYDDYILGIREELLYAKGDRIINNQMGVATTLIKVADSLLENIEISKSEIIVVYGEVYGGNIGRNKKNYTNSSEIGFRVFDVLRIQKKTLDELYEMDLNKISIWREHKGQEYLNTGDLTAFCKKHSLNQAPALGKFNLKELPTTIEGMYEFIKPFKSTLVGLDNVGYSEGIVIRSNDRKYIRKIRFEEYLKTLNLKR